jgi:hypothetical protein
MKHFAFLTALALALAFASSQAFAQNFRLSISGTAQFFYTNYVSTQDQYVETSAKETFNTSKIYTLVSNAVLSAPNDLGVVLPANGYIAFNPSTNDGEVQGVFYVTNKTGFYYPLSGHDENNTYYSFIELDADTYSFGELGFVNNDYTEFDDAPGYNYDGHNGNGSISEAAVALLFIHDDPYYYDDSDYPYEYTLNDTAIEIRGVFKIDFGLKDYIRTDKSIKLTGAGNMTVEGDDYGVVTSGTAIFSQ